jgi:hypothetical protein
MKKFKHKKTGEIAIYKDGILKSSGFAIELGVEPSSKYWEEIIEKDYEILSLARFCSIKPKITDVSDYGDGYIEALLKCDNARIHSVKRLSDSEIFTIGDKVIGYNNSIAKIKTIDLVGEVSLNIGTDKSEGFSLKNLKKAKQPLFTTEDGVDIFEGDEYYSVNEHYWTVLEPENTCKIDYETYHKNRHNFSTKEKAEEYILLNKPCLSINDINKLKCLTFSNWDKFLKESVKSKL